MQLVLEKKHLGNERIYIKNFELKLKFLENLREPLKSTRNRIDIDFERVSIVCALVRLTKTEKPLVLHRWL